VIPLPAAGHEAVGIVLAAGAGRRFGRPKILVDGWLGTAVWALREGGCGQVVVVTGAAAPTAAERLALPPGTREVRCADWDRGLSASVAAAARMVEALPDRTAVVLHVVDCPGVGSAAVERVLGALLADDAAPRRRPAYRATYAGRPGHPVALTAGALRGVSPRLEGDRGLGPLLEADGAMVPVECGDLADGRDVDTPEDGGVPDVRSA
jgi:CTP:molybdopterin cytidylyltransferase MocA